MMKRHPHPLWDIEHELSNMRRILDVWHHDTPVPVRRDVRARASTIEGLIQGVRRSAMQLLSEVMYPTQIALVSKPGRNPGSGSRRKRRK